MKGIAALGSIDQELKVRKLLLGSMELYLFIHLFMVYLILTLTDTTQTN